MLNAFIPTGILKDVDRQIDIKHHTRKVPISIHDPSKHVDDHMQELITSKLKGNRGHWFEYCVMDALMVFEDPSTGDTIDISRVRSHLDVVPPYNAEVDILINPTKPTDRAFFLYLKTSLRERWKQFDRDAILASFNPCKSFTPTTDIKYIGIFYREYARFTLEQNLKKAGKEKPRCHVLDDIITATDSSAMLSLFSRISRA